jgi:hypothetical protein
VVGTFGNPPAQCVVSVAGYNPTHVHFHKLVLCLPSKLLLRWLRICKHIIAR